MNNTRIEGLSRGGKSSHLDKIVRETVEEILNKFLQATVSHWGLTKLGSSG